jgi:Holliday junction resolvase RusA-like endonuclease
VNNQTKPKRSQEFVFENIEALSLQAHQGLSGKGGTPRKYNDSEIVRFKESIHYMAKQKRGRNFKKFDRIIQTISFFFQTDKPELWGEYYDKKPDFENIEKPFNDAIEGVLIGDDKKIVEKHVTKKWADQAAIILTLEEIK